MIRSDTFISSSRSLEISSTAQPSLAASRMRFWMLSAEAMSTPRVGYAATSIRQPRDSSRATTIFCWLPPESVPTTTEPSAAAMLYSEMRVCASRRAAAQSSIRAFLA